MARLLVLSTLALTASAAGAVAPGDRGSGSIGEDPCASWVQGDRGAESHRAPGDTGPGTCDAAIPAAVVLPAAPQILAAEPIITTPPPVTSGLALLAVAPKTSPPRGLQS